MMVLCAAVLARKPGFYVDGRYMYDKCGNKVVMRGVNEMFVWSDPQGTSLPEIEKSGANAVRIMWMMGKPLSQSETVVKKCIELGMIPLLEIHDATGNWSKLGSVVDYWVKDNSVTLIQKYQEYLIVNIANECGSSSNSSGEFIRAYTSAVTRMRQAGIHTPLMIDADRWGRNVDQLIASGPTLVENDPDHNLIFSWHSWDSNAPKSRYDDAIRQSIEKNICLVIGEFAHKEVGCRCCIDYNYIMEVCDKNDIGWLAWSWGKVSNGDCKEMDMAPGGSFDALAGWGREVALTSPYSIQNTAVRSPFIENGVCGGVKARIGANLTTGAIPLSVEFDGTSSYGDNLTFSWNFGDGASASTKAANHTFNQDGTYLVTLTVSDGKETDTDSTTITVVDPAKVPVNIALNKTVLSSSDENSAQGRDFVNDGNLTSRWASEFSDPQWITIDLGEPKSFGRVILRWETAHAREYKLQTSDDNQQWTDIHHEQDCDGGTDSLELSATARYVRMYGIQRATDWGYSLYEFEIYTLPGATRMIWGASGSPYRAMQSQPALYRYDIRGRKIRSTLPGRDQTARGIYIIGSPGARTGHRREMVTR